MRTFSFLLLFLLQFFSLHCAQVEEKRKKERERKISESEMSGINELEESENHEIQYLKAKYNVEFPKGVSEPQDKITLLLFS